MNEWLTFKIKDGCHCLHVAMLKNFKVNFEKLTNQKKNYLKLIEVQSC